MMSKTKGGTGVKTRRWLCWLLAVLLLVPGLVFADEEQTAPGDSALVEQISSTYAQAQKTAKVSSFKGYCGAYVARQLYLLGINAKYESHNGRQTYDAYCHLSYTTGGYTVTAYPAKSYTLSEALTAIAQKDPAATCILVGFEKSPSAAGQKFGHTLFIHGIEDGQIYFSDNCGRWVGGVHYKEGEPIACSLEDFAATYKKCKLDGVIHFERTVSSIIYSTLSHAQWEQDQ